MAGEASAGSPHHTLLGYISTKVVGIKHYPGEVSSGDTVEMLREPTNPYDSAAIEVRNASFIKLGYVPRKLASKLACYMDHGRIIIQGTISGPKRGAHYPLIVCIFASGDSTDQGALKTQLLNAGLEILHNGVSDSDTGASAAKTSPKKMQ